MQSQTSTWLALPLSQPVKVLDFIHKYLMQIYKHFLNQEDIRILITTIFRIPSRMRSNIAGTAVTKVGLSSDASPFVPFLTLLELSVKVKGEP